MVIFYYYARLGAQCNLGNMCARGETCDEECGHGMDGAVRWWRQAAAWVPERNAKQNKT